MRRGAPFSAPVLDLAPQWRRHGGNGGVRTPHFCSDPSWDLRKSVEKCFMYRGGGPMHVYCNILLLTSNNKNFGPPHFFWAGYATVAPSASPRPRQRLTPSDARRDGRLTSNRCRSARDRETAISKRDAAATRRGRKLRTIRILRTWINSRLFPVKSVSHSVRQSDSHPVTNVWRRRERGGGRGGEKSEQHFYSSLHSHSHSEPQNQTLKSNISKTVRDREKVSLGVR